jgi:diguanylate cyclase (GGDEF)-like protein
LNLANACAATGIADRARERYREAEAEFTAIGDRYHRLIVLNNLTVLEYESGNVAAAVEAAERLRRVCAPHEFNPDYAETVGQAYLSAGRYAEALHVLDEGERLLTEQGDSMTSTPAELALTHARVLLAAGDLDAAAGKVRQALAVCAERGLDGLRVRTLAVRAEVLAAAGDFEAAYHAHREFYAEAEALRSRQQDAAARTRQAIFETEEARREAQRFREQARTDPLTRLPNRRHVDEELPRLQLEASEVGLVLSAAVVDVDHFKRINDGFSHEVGDEVLRLLAGYLAEAARTESGRGFAARLGGEEFAVVRCDTTPADAVGAIERLRAAVEDAPWGDLMPGLRVTISAGLAIADDGDTQRSLLRRADGHLYDAKSAGRNRVLTDKTVTAVAS